MGSFLAEQVVSPRHPLLLNVIQDLCYTVERVPEVEQSEQLPEVAKGWVLHRTGRKVLWICRDTAATFALASILSDDGPQKSTKNLRSI